MNIDLVIPDNTVKICHSYASCTSFPNSWNYDGIVTFWDCPGFDEKRSETQEILNFYFMKNILMNSEQSKIVLAISYDLVNTKMSRGNLLADTFSKLINLFPNIELLSMVLSVVITRCPESYKPIDFGNSINALLSDNNRIKKSEELLRDLIRQTGKISIFKHTTRDSRIDLNDRSKILLSINFSLFVKLI